jgi:hypothetical protein
LTFAFHVYPQSEWEVRFTVYPPVQLKYNDLTGPSTTQGGEKGTSLIIVADFTTNQ